MPQWMGLVENHCDALELELGVLLEKKSSLQDDLEWNAAAIDMKTEKVEGSAVWNVEATAPEEAHAIPPFSPFQDPDHHNARVVSKLTTDRVAATDFQHHEPITQDKMRINKACALEVDWHHKLPGEIKVALAKGSHFHPSSRPQLSKMSVKRPHSGIPVWKEWRPCGQIWNGQEKVC